VKRLPVELRQLHRRHARGRRGVGFRVELRSSFRGKVGHPARDQHGLLKAIGREPVRFERRLIGRRLFGIGGIRPGQRPDAAVPRVDDVIGPDERRALRRIDVRHQPGRIEVDRDILDLGIGDGVVDAVARLQRPGRLLQCRDIHNFRTHRDANARRRDRHLARLASRSRRCGFRFERAHRRAPVAYLARHALDHRCRSPATAARHPSVTSEVTASLSTDRASSWISRTDFGTHAQRSARLAQRGCSAPGAISPAVPPPNSSPAIAENADIVDRGLPGHVVAELGPVSKRGERSEYGGIDCRLARPDQRMPDAQSRAARSQRSVHARPERPAR
jgi:hypothetical protein